MELRIYRTATELAEVSQFWRGSQHHPNSDYDHFRLVCESREEVLGPCVVGLFQNGQLTCLVLGRREKTALQSTIGYARFPGFGAMAITLIYSGIIGELDTDGARQIAGEFGQLLRRGEADVVTINLLPENSVLWAAFNELPLRTGQLVWAIHRSLTLKANKGFLLKDMRSKHRSWIRRKHNDFDEAFPDQVRWNWHSKIDDVSSLCEKMEYVSRLTYQRGLGAGFVDNEETRARLALFARQGQLRIFLLEVAGVPQAFWFGQVYSRVFHSAATGYSQELRQFEVGTLLFLQMVDRLIEDGVEQLDFGLGDASYKERFGDHAWREASNRIYAPTVKGTLLWFIQRSVDSIERFSRAAVHRFGNPARLKKLWRTRLQAKASRGHSKPSG